MQSTSERRRWTGIMGGLLVAAVACLGTGEAEAQGWPTRRYQAARNHQAEAELAARVAQLNQLVAQAQAEQAAAAAAGRRRRVYRPGEIPVDVPVNMPMYGPLTPGQRILNDTVAGQINGRARAACEAGRASQPYSIYRPGRINDGWYDTMTGPRLRGC
jgi:multidrug efflux pump subunit AcrA (membrane-fusion protein)